MGDLMLILTIILGMTTFICYAVTLGVYASQANFRSGMLFAVALPPDAAEDGDIARIRQRYAGSLRAMTLWTLLGLVPVALLYAWPGFQITAYWAWMAAFFFTITAPFRRAFRDTLELKRRNGWFVGTKRIVQVDLKAVRLAEKKSAPLWYFLIPFAMGAALVLHAWLQDVSLVPPASLGFLLTLSFFLLARHAKRSVAKAYSMNGEINQLLNGSRRRILSMLWLLLAIAENVHALLLYRLIARESPGDKVLSMSLLLLFAFIPAAMVYGSYSRIQRMERETLEADGRIIYSDDDEYWANGFTYHNPHDRRVLVPKRIGMGETINTGTAAGKWIMGGTLALTAAVLIGTSYMAIRSEVASPIMTIESGSRIEISYPMYSIGFEPSEMEALTLVDSVPRGSKRSGEATGKALRGHFKLEELGKARLFVFRNNPPYIRIKLKDEYVFYNESDPPATREQYRKLLEAGTAR